MDTRSPQPAAPSLATLLDGIMQDAKGLLVQELKLARLEGYEELGQFKTAVLMLGIGAVGAAVCLLLLSVMLVYALAAYTTLPLWGCYGIIGIGFGVLAGVLFVMGIQHIKNIAVLPQTVETMKENAQWIKELTTSDAISHTAVRP